MGLGAAAAVRITRRARAVRIGPAWNCGRIAQSARSEYTAAAFAEPLKRVFTGFYRPTQEVTVDVHPASRYFVRAIRLRADLAPWMEQILYEPLLRSMGAIVEPHAAASQRIDPLLSGAAARRAPGAAAGREVDPLMRDALVVAAQTLLLGVLAPAVVGYVRLAKARLQGRRGAGVLQPYRELRKTFGKGMVIAESASWIFHVAPFAIVGATIAAASLVPVVSARRRPINLAICSCWPRC